jgi:hypothetical protein
MPLAKGVIVEGAVAEPEVLTATIQELIKNPVADESGSSPRSPGTPSS